MKLISQTDRDSTDVGNHNASPHVLSPRVVENGNFHRQSSFSTSPQRLLQGMETIDSMLLLEHDSALQGVSQHAKVFALRFLCSEWMNAVARKLACRQTVVLKALLYLDRYLATEPLQNRAGLEKRMRIAAAACFYISVKLHNPSSVSPWQLSMLADSDIKAGDIEREELIVLSALAWQLHQPSADEYLHVLCALLPSECSDVPPSMIYDLTMTQIMTFAEKDNGQHANQFDLAAAALLNSLEVLGADTFEVQHIHGSMQTDTDATSLLSLRERLFYIL